MKIRAWPLGVLAGFTVVAVVGYGVFGLHPERLPASDLGAAVYRASFGAFARIHIGLSAAVLALALVRTAGLRWLPGLVLVYLATFLAEFVGTGYGVPFGGYSYSALLGAKLGGRVPALIPLSWFVMAVPSFALSRAVLPGRELRAGRILVAALLLVVWDLSLDPAMSGLTPYWSWDTPGPYHGMPLGNLAGWLLTGLVVMVLLEAAGALRWTAALGPRWTGAFYGTVLLMPLGMCVAAGLLDVAFLTAAGLAGALGLALALRRREAAAARGGEGVRGGPDRGVSPVRLEGAYGPWRT